jgi:hypothetical protein
MRYQVEGTLSGEQSLGGNNTRGEMRCFVDGQGVDEMPGWKDIEMKMGVIARAGESEMGEEQGVGLVKISLEQQIIIGCELNKDTLRGNTLSVDATSRKLALGSAESRLAQQNMRVRALAKMRNRDCAPSVKRICMAFPWLLFLIIPSYHHRVLSTIWSKC